MKTTVENRHGMNTKVTVNKFARHLVLMVGVGTLVWAFIIGIASLLLSLR